MKLFSRTVFLTAAVLGLASFASADSVTLTYLHNSGISQGGYGVGPRAVLINGEPASLVCIDFDHNVSRGQSWEANVSTFDSLADVRFIQGTPTATLQLYDEAAFLYLQMLSSPSTGWGNIQYALWAIFDPAVMSMPGFTSVGSTSSSYWLGLVESQTFTPGEFSNVVVYTPIDVNGRHSPQEFMGTVPEPGTLLLLGTGLLGGLLRRRKKQ